MKKTSATKRLALNKVSISELNDRVKQAAKGGGTNTLYICTITCYSACNYATCYETICDCPPIPQDTIQFPECRPIM